MDIKVKDILRVCDGELLSGSEDVICENFSNDTRTINNGDVYVGIRVHDIEDCPSFHFPQIENALSPKTKLDGGTPQCWATLYIDANGKDEPNVEGRDIYKFGLDALGVYH